MPVLLGTICNTCQNKADMWADRDLKGFPTLQGAVCGHCGGRNCITRVIQDDVVHALIPPLEDGNINRFEYSFTNDNGKRVTKKMDPKMVDKHFQQNNKG